MERKDGCHSCLQVFTDRLQSGQQIVLYLESVRTLLHICPIGRYSFYLFIFLRSRLGPGKIGRLRDRTRRGSLLRYDTQGS